MQRPTSTRRTSKLPRPLKAGLEPLKYWKCRSTMSRLEDGAACRNLPVPLGNPLRCASDVSLLTQNGSSCAQSGLHIFRPKQGCDIPSLALLRKRRGLSSMPWKPSIETIHRFALGKCEEPSNKQPGAASFRRCGIFSKSPPKTKGRTNRSCLTWNTLNCEASPSQNTLFVNRFGTMCEWKKDFRVCNTWFKAACWAW